MTKCFPFGKLETERKKRRVDEHYIAGVTKSTTEDRETGEISEDINKMSDIESNSLFSFETDNKKHFY